MSRGAQQPTDSSAAASKTRKGGRTTTAEVVRLLVAKKNPTRTVFIKGSQRTNVRGTCEKALASRCACTRTLEQQAPYAPNVRLPTTVVMQLVDNHNQRNTSSEKKPETGLETETVMVPRNVRKYR